MENEKLLKQIKLLRGNNKRKDRYDKGFLDALDCVEKLVKKK